MQTDWLALSQTGINTNCTFKRQLAVTVSHNNTGQVAEMTKEAGPSHRLILSPPRPAPYILLPKTSSSFPCTPLPSDPHLKTTLPPLFSLCTLPSSLLTLLPPFLPPPPSSSPLPLTHPSPCFFEPLLALPPFSSSLSPPPLSRVRPNVSERAATTRSKGRPALSLLLGVSHAASQIRPQQRCLARLLPRCLLPKERQQVSAPSAAARGGVLHLTMITITTAPASAASRFSPWISCSFQSPPPPDDGVSTTPTGSPPPGFQSLAVPDADSLLTGFRPVGFPLRSSS